MGFQNAVLQQCTDFFQKAMDTASKRPNMERLQEISDLNEVYKTRAIALQKIWANDWAQLFESAKQMASFQDLPNFAGHYSQFFNQSEKQLAKQMEEYTELMENTVASYSYWVAKQIQNEYRY